MKQKELVIQNGGTKFFLGSNLSLRSLLKHFITFTYLVLITIILFSTKLDLGNVTSIDLKTIIKSVIIILFLTRSTVASLKMLNQSFKSFLVTTLFIIGMIGASIAFVVIKMDDKVNEWKDLANLIFIYVGIPLYVGIWKLTIAAVEVHSSPFLSKKMIFKGLSHIVSAIYIFVLMLFMKETYLATPKTKIDLWNSLHMTYLISIASLFIAYTTLSYIGWRVYGKKITKIWHIKSISLSIGIILVIPLAIWLPMKSFLFRSEWNFYLYIALNATMVIIILFYSFIRKTEMASPKIYVILVTMIITMIWGLKFLYGYQFGIEVPEDFTLTTSLISTAAILLIQYFKSPNIGKGVSMVYRMFAVSLFFLSLGLWLSLHFSKELDSIKKIVDIPELLNILLLILPTMLALSSMLSWTVTMMKIKKYSKKRKYQLTKKNEFKAKKLIIEKEASNA